MQSTFRKEYDTMLMTWQLRAKKRKGASPGTMGISN